MRVADAAFLNRARLDLLVQHYLSMKIGTDVVSGRLFSEYKTWTESGKGFATLADELHDLAVFADFFLALLRPVRTTTVGRFAERLRALDTSTVYPLVLGLLGNKKVEAKERDGILADLESFLVRRVVCGRPTKNYNRLFLQLLRDFGEKEPTRQAFRSLLTAGTGENVDWPDDKAFERAWTTRDAYSDLKAAKVETMLRAINDAMVTQATESFTLDGKLTVEHVLPQQWTKHWPLPDDSLEAMEERDAVLHSFGNLTLLTQPLNSAVSNGPASQKLPKIALQSALRLNTHFQGRTTWTEKDARERGAALFEIAKVVWPHP